MITRERIEQLATKYQTSQQNIVREYCQHLFLLYFYQQDDANKVLFKGGTALRIVLGSSRFSEDLDFSAISGISKQEVETMFANVLVDIEKLGIDVDFDESKDTKDGFLGIVKFKINGCDPVDISIEISFRDINKTIDPDVIMIASDFVQSYTLFHLPVNLLVQEKLKATLSRKKPRDFYDVYFIMRKNLIKTENKKNILPQIKNAVLSSDINFRNELTQFLPVSQHRIIDNFRNVLVQEIDRNLGY